MTTEDATAVQHLVRFVLSLHVDGHLLEDSVAHALVSLAERAHRVLSSGPTGGDVAAALIQRRSK